MSYDTYKKSFWFADCCYKLLYTCMKNWNDKVQAIISCIAQSHIEIILMPYTIQIH